MIDQILILSREKKCIGSFISSSFPSNDGLKETGFRNSKAIYRKLPRIPKEFQLN